MENLTPRQIVSELDRYIIGQDEAKKTVAVALRNRYRRSQLNDDLRAEVTPTNIIMIGPTGVGKTEIARRLAKLVKAPFVKVEATKFTEVGYVGRDVESMVRDLVEAAIRMIEEDKTLGVRTQAQKLAEERLLDIMAPLPKKASSNPLEMFFGKDNNKQVTDSEIDNIKAQREILRQKLRRMELEDEIVEIEVKDTNSMNDMLESMGMDDATGNFGEMFSGIMPGKTKKRKVTVEKAKKILTEEEAEKLVDFEDVKQEAINLDEKEGIIFLDEIDKIASSGGGHGPDVSREGVQRDILPIVEGSVVKTKYGNVKTDHILFIAAGAFHVSKPEDLIPELQGRFPVRVKLESLSEHDLERILTEPESSLIKQYTAMIAVDGINLNFTPDGVQEIAEMAYILNEESENIGARRLHTMMERLLSEVMFEGSDLTEKDVVVDSAYVAEKLGEMTKGQDLSAFIL